MLWKQQRRGEGLSPSYCGSLHTISSEAHCALNSLDLLHIHGFCKQRSGNLIWMQEFMQINYLCFSQAVFVLCSINKSIFEDKMLQYFMPQKHFGSKHMHTAKTLFPFNIISQTVNKLVNLDSLLSVFFLASSLMLISSEYWCMLESHTTSSHLW